MCNQLDVPDNAAFIGVSESINASAAQTAMHEMTAKQSA